MSSFKSKVFMSGVGMVVRLAICLSLAVFANAQSALDGFTPLLPGASEGVAGLAVAVQADGKVIFGGGFVDFEGTSRKNLTRLHPNGALDTTFDAQVAGLGSNPVAVGAIAIQPTDNKILIGGSFTTVGGQSHHRIARLFPNGTVDTGFGPGIDNGAFSQVSSIVCLPSGQILIAGTFTSVGGVSRNGIARLNSNGSLDSGFNPSPTGGPSTYINAIMRDSNGKILVGGSFTNIGGQPKNNLALLDSNGNADPSFSPDPNGPVGAFAMQSGGRILVSGSFTSIDGVARDKLARLRPNGAVDLTFFPPQIQTTGFDPAWVGTLAVQTDDQIIIGGEFHLVAGEIRYCVARLTPDGGLDLEYSPRFEGGNFRTQIYDIALQPDGKAVFTGDFYTVNGLPRVSGARLERDGMADDTLDQLFLSTPSIVKAIATQPDGKTLIGGEFQSSFGDNLARLKPNGTPDFDFTPTIDGRVAAVVIQLDGKIVIGGDFTTVNGQPRAGLARLNPDGTLDAGFDFATDSSVEALAIQGDRILVGGSFGTIGGVSRNGLARLVTDSLGTTTVDSAFNPNTSGAGVFYTITLQGNKILVGGGFNFLGGQSRSNIARLNDDGSADSFDPATDNSVLNIALLPNGKIALGGTFTSLTPNGGATASRARLAIVNGDGTLDATFADPLADGTVFAIAPQADGKIIVGGQFMSIGGQLRSRIARISADGTADGYDVIANNDVVSLAFQNDGKVLVGGRFTQIAGQSRNSFARLTNSSSVTPQISVSGTAVRLLYSGPGGYGPLACFEYSVNGGITWTVIGCPNGVITFPRPGLFKSFGPTGGTGADVEYSLAGLNLPTGQNLLIRVQMFTGNSGSYQEFIQSAFLATPTAANVSVAGRVTMANGQGVRNARVTLTAPNGQRRTATTSTFGYYSFDAVETGQTYTVDVTSRKLSFDSPTRVISLQDNITDLDFVAVGR